MVFVLQSAVPLTVKVNAPTAKVPAVNVSVPLTVFAAVRVTVPPPNVLLIVKLFTVAGSPVPVACEAAILL